MTAWYVLDIWDCLVFLLKKSTASTLQNLVNTLIFKILSNRSYPLSQWRPSLEAYGRLSTSQQTCDGDLRFGVMI